HGAANNLSRQFRKGVFGFNNSTGPGRCHFFSSCLDYDWYDFLMGYDSPVALNHSPQIIILITTMIKCDFLMGYDSPAAPNHSPQIIIQITTMIGYDFLMAYDSPATPNHSL